MNKTAIKNFAVEARVMLLEAVKQRAFEYEVTEGGKNDPAQEAVNGATLTAEERNQRAQLIAKVKANGFSQTMEEAAYTWFNRFIALRFMEVNNYLPSHTRIFSDESGAFKPEVLADAASLSIDGLDRDKVLDMQDKQERERLYKYIIITQCNALNEGLPEMFEQIGGWTELLFPKNLLRDESVIAKMVTEIPEEDWKDQVQIIGWLYQYYNTEPKDKVFADMKKNIKISAEAIPAATQLFTPDWIVRYMVENSLGRLWAEGHGKPAGAEWKYYLEEAEQGNAVKAELEKIRAEYRNIRPEEIKVIDPCMGSGHILVYAFDVLMQIYTDQGWSEREAAESILRCNLYGLDIDRRAYQLAYFAVMMKARQYNRRILRAENQPNLANFADTVGADISLLTGDIRRLAEQFADADTYGSLMEAHMPSGLSEAGELSPTLGISARQLEMMAKAAAILSQKYDAVITNPPYMGGSGMNTKLSAFVKARYADSKADLFACFIERCAKFAKPHGYYAMITQHAFMFLSSYEKLRKKLALKTTVNMAHLGARAFDEICGEVVQTTAFANFNSHIAYYKGEYSRLVDVNGEAEKEKLYLSHEKIYLATQENFSKIPGSPVAYWVSENVFNCFEKFKQLKVVIDARIGMVSGDNERFLRFWQELRYSDIEFNAKPNLDPKNVKWYPLQKGGDFRHWYGNLQYVINWKNDGYEVKHDNFMGKRVRSHNYNGIQQFKEGITWNSITSSKFTCRYSPIGFTYDAAGPLCEVKDNDKLYYVLGFLTSKVTEYFFSLINPTINFPSGYLEILPYKFYNENNVDYIVKHCISLSKTDWDSFETSWDFKRHPLV